MEPMCSPPPFFKKSDYRIPVEELPTLTCCTHRRVGDSPILKMINLKKVKYVSSTYPGRNAQITYLVLVRIEVNYPEKSCIKGMLFSICLVCTYMLCIN